MHFDTGVPDRDLVLNHLHTHLIGPAGGPDEVLDGSPSQRYLSGILYPQQRQRPHGPVAISDPVPDNEAVHEADGRGDDRDGQDDDPISLAGQDRPSSVGISFVTTVRSPLLAEIRCGTYHEHADGWQRCQITFTGTDAIRVDPPSGSQSGESSRNLVDGRLILRVRWRPLGDRTVVSAVLVNGTMTDTKSVDDSECFFQVQLCCRPVEGSIARYPGRQHLHDDESAAELELQYRSVPVYALGHGSGAEWDGIRAGTPPTHVRTTFLPVHVVPDVSFDVGGDREVLLLEELAKIQQHPEHVVELLDRFVDGYEEWLRETRESLPNCLQPEMAQAANRLLVRAGEAATRMRRGVDLLRTPDDDIPRKAFALANHAMLMQMVHRDVQFAGTTHPVSSAPTAEPVYRDTGHRWRPFQLGFQLLTITGVVQAGDERDLVDLIWFPTGGGKTEAYLAVAAFSIMHRRLTLGDDGAGTAIITRYTLRLLTSQQFHRTATMIAACERVRKENEDELGGSPISIGIWVGSKNAPNTFAEARKLFRELKTAAAEDTELPEQSFQIDSCPWCGTRIVPTKPEHEPVWGVIADNDAFRMRCVNDHCYFSTGLPISCVDQDLYQRPPTMLIGTVDKFASAAWREEPGVFFGSAKHPAPSLIIQDEFHLISGPLGTVVGLYEAAFDVLVRRAGGRPKIVAATATIRSADEQVRGVFGRKVALFPPPGVDAANSYFVRSDPDSPGRAYVGVMPQGHTPVTGLVHVVAAQLQAPEDLDLSDTGRDAYSTLVAYHNSLRELGKTVTLAMDDIPSRIEIVATHAHQLRAITDDNTIELTSSVRSSKIQGLFEQLSVGCDKQGSIAFLACTNMLSVGVDVGRLGMMTVVGQPKSTAEYIQATSRVGRKPTTHPGLIVTLYSPSKPRDRSHYESFIPYHATLYRSVEPSSVTPFSVAARHRALHANLVVLVRHALGLRENTDAARFAPETDELAEVLRLFVERVRAADPDEVGRVSDHLDALAEHWCQLLAEAARSGAELVYSSSAKRPRLLRRHAQPGPGWPTLDSMRSVDVEARIGVRGERS